MNGLVRWLATRYGLLIFPVKWHNRPSVKWMFSDLPTVKVLGVANDAEALWWSGRFRHNGVVMRLGVHSRQPLRVPGWDKQFYEQAGVPFEERWKGFKLPTTQSKPWPHSKPLLHEDQKRGFTIDRNRIPEDAIPVSHFPIIFDVIPWMQQATELHVIDSSFLCLADSIPTAASRLVFHKYARPGGRPPTLRKQWEVL